MSQGLTGKRVLVTGASAGIGRASVLALAARGAEIIATGRRKAALESLRTETKSAGGRIETIAGDLNDAGFVRELAGAAADVDILLNNAGVLTYAPVLDMQDHECEEMFRTNVLAAFRIAQAIARPMVERKRGHIIVMTSTAARDVYRLGVVYCATKHALSALTRGLRLELQGHGIKVTEIAPGMVDTHIRDASRHPAVLEAMKTRKYGPLTAEEIAEAVVYAAEAEPNCCPDLIELRPQGAA
ncbi:MAG TPA: SDR family oxidoreductase [Stellaceae bacterium]|nr:SDR family oxidoreductase [Stellaceae bacterium]